jgi:hypothetical protein
LTRPRSSDVPLIVAPVAVYRASLAKVCSHHDSYLA